MKKIFSSILMLAMALPLSLFPSMISADSPHLASVAITSLTDDSGTHTPPFSFSCPSNPLFNPVSVGGSGTVTNPSGSISQYHYEVDWGDGTTTVGSTFSGTDPYSFSFNFGPHTYTTNGNFTIVAKVYHQTSPGHDTTDSQTIPVTVCVHVPPPTSGSITVTKVVSGGTAQVSDFTLKVGTTTVTSGVVKDFLAGNYTVSESGGPSGYSGAFSGDCDATGHVNIVAGQHYDCTLTNTFTPPVNTPPVAPTTLSIITNEDTATSSTLIATDSDIPAQTLTYSVVANPSHGTISGFNSLTGAYTYTPAADYNGSDSFTFKANDGSADSNVATVNITVNPVNDVPSFTKGADQTVAEDAGPQTVSGWATNLSPGPANESSQTLNFIVTNDNNSLFSSQPAIAPDGTLTYTSAPNANGSATVTVSIHDNGGTANGGVDTSATQTFTITVTPVNDAPVALNDTYSTNEDTAVTISAPGVLNNDYDIDGPSLTAVKLTDPSNGTVTLNSDGSFTYTPKADFVGSDSFTYQASDGSLTSNTATVTINVASADETPTAVADNYNVNEDGVLTVNNSLGVLANDSGDIDGDMTANLVTGVTHGTLSLNADGSFTYTPVEGYFGPDSFVYTANDGANASSQTLVTITVNPVPGTLTIIKDTVGGNGTFTFSITGQDNVDVTTTNGEGSTSPISLSPGNYNVAEIVPEGWNFSGVSCVYENHSVGNSIASGEAITLLGNDSVVCTFTDTKIVPKSSDLSITKSVDNTSPNINVNVTYTLTASNAGPDDATGVSVSDLLPNGVTYVSDDGAGSYDSNTGVWTIGNLSTTSSATLHITVSTNGTDVSGQTITNTATVSGDNGDSNTDNNSGSAPLTINIPTQPTDVCSNIDGVQTSVPSGMTESDGICTPIPPPPSGGGGGGGGGGNGPVVGLLGGGGSVLGASTTTGQVLGESCGLYMEKHVRLGSSKNDVEQVKKLQTFLNKWMSSKLPVTGFYGPMTFAQVEAFQSKYSDDVLKPWNLSAPTGLVYLSTLREINNLECPDLALQLPPLVPWSQNPNAQ